jgi:hypothetical protein
VELTKKKKRRKRKKIAAGDVLMSSINKIASGRSAAFRVT